MGWLENKISELQAQNKKLDEEIKQTQNKHKKHFDEKEHKKMGRAVAEKVRKMI